MSTPTAGQVHVNRPLTNISIAYMQSASAFVADQVFPNVPVQKQADKYFRYDRSDFFRNQMQKRAESTESAGSGWKVDSTPTYFCDKYALHKDISDDIRANADAPLNMDRDATEWLSQQAMVNRETTWAANYMAASVWTGVTGAAQDITGVASDSPSTNQVSQWNRSAATPIANVKTYCSTSQGLTGFRPNKLVIGRQVWDALSEHDDLVSRIQYSSSNNNPAVVSKMAAAALMEIDAVLVADGLKATTAENPAFETSMTIARIIGKTALLVYANPRPSLLMPSGGYTFSWTGYLNGQGQMGQVVKSFRMENLSSDRVEIEQAYDQKVVCTDCGVYFASIVA